MGGVCKHNHLTDPEVKTLYLLEQTLDDNRLRGKPGQIFNMDESSMTLDPKAPVIVAQKSTEKHRKAPMLILLAQATDLKLL